MLHSVSTLKEKMIRIAKWPKIRRLFSVVLITNVIITFVLVFSMIAMASSRVTDFCQDYIAAERLINGIQVYKPLHCAEFEHLSIDYNAHPPFSVFLYVPLTFLPYHIAAIIWSSISYILFLTTGLLLLRLIPIKSKYAFAGFVLVSVSWYPFQTSIIYQNIIHLLLLLLTLGFYFQKNGKDRCAGICFGIASLLRFWPFVLILGALLTKRVKVFYWGLVVFILGMLLTVAVMGVDTYREYLGPVQKAEQTWISQTGNISFVRYEVLFFENIGFSRSSATHAALVISGIIFISVCSYFFHKKIKSYKESLIVQSVLLTLTLLLFPLVWDWGMLIILLPITVVISLMKGKSFKPFNKEFFVISVILLFNPVVGVLQMMFPYNHGDIYLITDVFFQLGILCLLYLYLQMYKQLISERPKYLAVEG